ncbi:competence protein CoiA [Levilactobacillus fuyuanensis]|uniref:Competence protein CoiA n=1 Tax=Levilactobacillus fuyuanensis TaxID=2486022 RepID=A0ABW4H184_9LACO|nr:competence protein CoiA family protein [Levilactobacillus fuyuanensis]
MATMLIALLKGKLIDAAYAERLQDYCCPTCQQRVTLHHGTHVQPYFAHRPREACTIFSEGETQQHLRGKRQLMTFFESWGVVSLERILPDIQQRADCWVEREKKCPIAIEFQCSPIMTSQVLGRTRGYQKLKVYPFWILGSRYGKQKLGWSLIERFATRLRGWGLCLLFWDVQRQRMRIDHHLYQDALGNYHRRTTWLLNIGELVAGNQLPLPKLVLDYPQWRSRLARDLQTKRPAVLAIQEVLYPTGHHILDVPDFLMTTTITLPVFGQGLLLWRALMMAQLFALPVLRITGATMDFLVVRSFKTVGGHQQAVWFSADEALLKARRSLLADLMGLGYLRPIEENWQICRRPKWAGEA